MELKSKEIEYIEDILEEDNRKMGKLHRKQRGQSDGSDK